MMLVSDFISIAKWQNKEILLLCWWWKNTSSQIDKQYHKYLCTLIAFLSFPFHFQFDRCVCVVRVYKCVRLYTIQYTHNFYMSLLLTLLLFFIIIYSFCCYLFGMLTLLWPLYTNRIRVFLLYWFIFSKVTNKYRVCVDF